MRYAPIAILVIAASTAQAQIIRSRVSNEASTWLGLSAGLVQMQGVADGRTESTWNFGSGLQYRASAEQAWENQASYGVTATLARMPLVYRGPACADCDAHANVWSVQGSFHIGGGIGFHQVYEVSAGVTRFENFRDDRTGTKLTPNADTDFSFTIGAGFGFAANSRLSFVLVQDLAYIVHQSEGQRNNSSNMASQYITRLGVRYGVGYKK